MFLALFGSQAFAVQVKGLLCILPWGLFRAGEFLHAHDESYNGAANTLREA